MYLLLKLPVLYPCSDSVGQHTVITLILKQGLCQDRVGHLYCGNSQQKRNTQKYC